MTQPEALRLADLLEDEANLTMTNDYIRKAAHELRRLHNTIKGVNMTFEQWWQTLTPAEQKMLGYHNAKFVWQAAQKEKNNG